VPRKSTFARLEDTVLVSDCLSGIQCRYDGSSNIHNSILNIPEILLIPIGTEQLGGLATLLPSAHLAGDDGLEVVGGQTQVITEQGQAVTAAFLLGASQAVKISRILRAGYAILKERRPSCETHAIWIEGHLKDGL
jgi:uncharacterized protein YbbK (DUF523 family)